MNRICLLCLFLATTACTTVRSVQIDSLRSLEAGQRDGVAVRGRNSVFRARLAPTSRIKLETSTGETRWIDGSELRVSSRGVFIDADPDVSETSEARVEGLAPHLVHYLRVTRPVGALLEKSGREWVLKDSEGQLGRWLRLFRTRAIVAQSRPYRARFVCTDEKGVVHIHSRRAALHLDASIGPACRREEIKEQALRRADRRVRGDGQWTFSRGGVVVKATLRRALDQGLPAAEGWRWEDIEGAEVEFVSGPKSLAAFVAIGAASVALAPFAFLGGGGGSGGGPGRSGGSGVAAIRAGARGAVRVVGTGVDAALTPERKRDGTASGIKWVARRETRPLFSNRAKVASIARLVGHIDAGLAPRELDRASLSFALSVRLVDVLELGGGVRRLSWNRSNRGWATDTIGFFRGGAYFPLDAAHRLAIPVSVELGGSSDSGFVVRAQASLRYALSQTFFVDLSPLSFTKHKATQRRGQSGWRYEPSVGVGFEFP